MLNFENAIDIHSSIGKINIIRAELCNSKFANNDMEKNVVNNKA